MIKKHLVNEAADGHEVARSVGTTNYLNVDSTTVAIGSQYFARTLCTSFSSIQSSTKLFSVCNLDQAARNLSRGDKLYYYNLAHNRDDSESV